MKRIKYMGMSHEHRLEAGDDFGGRLAEGIQNTVVFNRGNNWIVDADDPKVALSADAVDILVSTGEWKDVTDLARIPLNRHQTTFLGLTDGDKVGPIPGEIPDEELQYAAPEDAASQLTPEQEAEEQAKRDAVEAERVRLEAEVADSDAKAKVKSKGQ